MGLLTFYAFGRPLIDRVHSSPPSRLKYRTIFYSLSSFLSFFLSRLVRARIRPLPHHSPRCGAIIKQFEFETAHDR